MWKVTLYKNTGLNSVNTLANPSLLPQTGSVNLPALDILQAEFLTTVTVKAVRNQVKDADFLMLENTENSNEKFFYSIESFTSTSVDVQVLSITFDALLTLEFLMNGIENIQILDGIVERHTVQADTDNYGYYTEDDPLLVPSRELGFVAVQMYHPQYSAEGDPTDIIPKTIVQSRVELTEVTPTATTYYSNSEVEKVTLPNPPPPVKNPSLIYMPLSDGDGQIYVNKSTQFFDYDHQSVKTAMEEIQRLGLERSAVIASYSLVQNYDYEGTGQPGFNIIKGKYMENTVPNVDFNYDSSIVNKRVLYGTCNKFEIISVASGVRMEFKPEDICFDEDGQLLDGPIVCRASDPRPVGRPYYGFKFYRGINQFRHTYLSNVVPGMEWPSVPIVYTGLSGSTLNEIRYTTQREGDRLSGQQQIDAMNYDLGESRMRRTIDLGKDALKALGTASLGAVLPAVIPFAGSYVNTAIDQSFDDTRAQFNKAQLDERYAYNAYKELQELQLTNTIVAPDVHFPNSETLRDFLGNGIYVIQYRPTSGDRKKMDRILTMYGYKDTKTLEASDFVTRRINAFAYVKANSVSIGGDVPVWIREAAAAQISNGVRVWTRKPDPRYYTGIYS